MNDSREKIASRSAEAMLGPNPVVGMRARHVLGEGLKALGLLARQPRLTARTGAHLAARMAEVARGVSALAPAPRDRRFKDEAWENEEAYRRWLQAWLAWTETTHEWVEQQPGLSKYGRMRLEFLVDLLNDAIAPSNFPWQPVAVRKFRETGGASARAGLKNFLTDLRENRGLPSQVDRRQFKPGENLATTEGAVVERNEVMELIQYQPKTEKVHAVPLLVVPPQINKYYVFDLSPEKSLVKGLLEAGFQVFVVSWRNPTKEHADWGLAEYASAIESAVSVACNITKQKRVNMLGACAGGITLAAFVAMRRAVGDERINSVTMLVNVLDTGALGDTALGLFAGPRAVDAAKRLSKRKGVLDGKDMATAFAWLRPNDLIWNYWVNNILLGNPPPAFDVLYWNNDSTRLPARLHAEFLDIYKNNALTEPGELRLHGVPVDLAHVDCDSYLLAGTSDHITPWRACYRSTLLFGGDTTFVLSNSGHIQSILNPPSNKKKSEFWIAPGGEPDPSKWHENAEHVEGSWWPHWYAWLSKRSGRKHEAPATVGNDAYPPMEAAPGRYIFE